MKVNVEVIAQKLQSHKLVRESQSRISSPNDNIYDMAVLCVRRVCGGEMVTRAASKSSFYKHIEPSARTFDGTLLLQNSPVRLACTLKPCTAL